MMNIPDKYKDYVRDAKVKWDSFEGIIRTSYPYILNGDYCVTILVESTFYVKKCDDLTITEKAMSKPKAKYAWMFSDDDTLVNCYDTAKEATEEAIKNTDDFVVVKLVSKSESKTRVNIIEYE